MFSAIWARITGADKGRKFPEQQVEALGRVGDLFIIYPYGLYCNVPTNTRVKQYDKGAAFPVTVVRPNDIAQGEPVFFHPETNTRIIARNDGSLDIETGTGGTAPVNIKCTEANIEASSAINVTTTTATIEASSAVDVTTPTMTIDGDLVVTGTASAPTIAAATSLAVGGLEMSNHIHSQGNDSDGDTEVDTGGPHA